MSSLKDALSEAMKENGSWMTHMKKDHEVQLRTQKDMVKMYRKQNEKLEEENKKLKEHLEGSAVEEDEDGFAVSDWFHEHLDKHIKFHLTEVGGEYNYIDTETGEHIFQLGKGGTLDEVREYVEKLKEEKQQYQPKGSQIDPEGLHDYMKQQIDELKAWLEIKTGMAESLQKEVDIEHTRYLQEAIKRGDIQQELADLKEEVEEWKEVANEYHLETPSQLESWMSAAIHEDEEEYSKYMEPLELRDEVKKLKEELKKWMDERLSFGLGLMSVKDTLDEILYGDKDGCPYEHDHEKDQSTNLWDSWKVRIKSIGELKEDITNHPDFAEIATDWYERHVWMVDKDEFEKLQEENKKLKIPEGVMNAFNSLTSNWWSDEEKYYSENFPEHTEKYDDEPENIPTKHLLPCNYTDLRHLDDWFNKGIYHPYEDEEETDEEDPTDK